MRGEHERDDLKSVVVTGSSPHARGARHVLTLAGLIAGIIPACAGSTLDHHAHALALRDHPRMRGEHCAVL